MIEFSVHSNLLMNSFLVKNLVVNPPDFKHYDSYNELLPNILTSEVNDLNAEDYQVDISPQAYNLSLLDKMLTKNDWLSKY